MTTVMITIRVTPKEREKIKADAAGEGVSVNAWVRRNLDLGDKPEEGSDDERSRTSD